MKKLIFSMLCILGGVYGPVYTIVNPVAGEAVTNNDDVPIQLHLPEVPSLTELQNALTAIKPELLFEGLIINAKLIVGEEPLSPNNTDELLADDGEIGLVTGADMMKLPMGDTLHTQNVNCEFQFTYLNAYSTAQNRTTAQRVYASWLERGTSNTMHSLFGGSGRNLLQEMTPYIDNINFSCETDNSRLTIVYNPSVLNRLNGQRYKPWRILMNIYNHIYCGGSLSSITQDVLDLNNYESPGAWVIAE